MNGAPEPAIEQTPAETPAGPSRIAALDWARGWMLVASVGVNSAFLSFAPLQHHPWAGIRPIDLIFPLFVTLAGCGTAFAFRRRVQFGGVLRRSLVLIALGLVYNALTTWTFDISQLRIPGVLQLYGVIVIVMALLHLVTRSWRGWLVITTLIAIAHSAVLSIFGLNCAADLLTRECNPSGPLDAAVFGAAHIYQSGLAGHDPEGLLAIFGALVSASAGATIGHLLLQTRREHVDWTRRLPAFSTPLLVTVGVFVALAFVCLVVPDLLGGAPVPAMKRLWTAPFALAVAALAAALLWLGELAMPAKGRPRDHLWNPIISLGRNSLLVYFGSHLAMALLARPLGDGPSILELITSRLGPPLVAQVVWSAVWLVAWVALAIVLNRFKIYVKP